MSRLRIAVIVPVHNEAVFLPQLIRHYEPEVDTIFVLDNDSDDGSTDGLSARHPKVVVSRHPTGGRFMMQWKTDLLEAKKRECTGGYDYVVVVDADEFVVPKQGTIRDTIEATGRRDLYGTEGWNLFQYPGDAPYDAGLPMLRQRRRGAANSQYSKPIIVRPELDTRYCYGGHYIVNRQDPRPPGAVSFWLFHLKFFDSLHWLDRILRIQRRSGDADKSFRRLTEKDFIAQYEYERDASRATRIVPDRF